MSKTKKRIICAVSIVAVLLVVLVASVCMNSAGDQKPEKDAGADEVVGTLSLVANFDDDYAVYDGHSFLVFTSSVDNLELNFTDLYGYYTMTDSYKEKVASDSNNLAWNTTVPDLLAKYYPDTTVEEYAALADSERSEKYPKVQSYCDKKCYELTLGEEDSDPHYRTASYDCVMNAGDYISIGNYTMVESTAQMIADALTTSSLFDEFKGVIEEQKGMDYGSNIIVSAIVDIIMSSMSDSSQTEEQDSQISEYLISELGQEGYSDVKSLFVSKRGYYDGDTTGGLFVNRELWRQKSWQTLSPNQVISINITRSQLNNMMEYLNSGDANHYSLAAHNCSSVSSTAWNAAVGYVQDDQGKNTSEQSALYLDASDTTYKFLGKAFDTPKRICEVAKEWAKSDNGVTVDSWDIIQGYSVTVEY